MKIVIQTQYYPPEVGAPQTRLHEFAVGLTNYGVKVTVLTAIPSYPVGQICHGYKNWFQEEFLEGVKIIRTPILPTQSVKTIPRLLNYFSFMISSLIGGVRNIGRVDFVFTESPPIFLGIAGILLSRLTKARWIINIADLWPESVMELGLIDKDSISYKLGNILEKYLYKRAWLVSCQSKTILENIINRYPDVPTYHFPNGVNTNLFKPKPTKPYTDKFRLIYAGLHGLAQGLNQILIAAKNVGHVEFIFVGDGPEKKRLIDLANDLKLENVTFFPPVEKEKIPEYLNGADAVLIPLKRQLTGAVPSKLYEAMAMQKPLVLIASNEAAKIVKAAKCGIIVSPGDIEGLIDAITRLSKHPNERMEMGARGRESAVQNHDRATIVRQFVQYLSTDLSLFPK